MKVKAINLNSANVKYDNSEETERVYIIEANVNISKQEVISMDAGVVKKGDVQMASFNMYGNHQKNINYIGDSNEEEECAILKDINAFISSVESKVESKPINL